MKSKSDHLATLLGQESEYGLIFTSTSQHVPCYDHVGAVHSVFLNSDSMMALLTTVGVLYFFQGCCLLWLLQCMLLSFEPMLHPLRFCLCITLPTLVGIRAYKRRKLTLGGTLCGIFVGFVLLAVHLGLFLALCAFFFAGTAATRYSASRKVRKVSQLISSTPPTTRTSQSPLRGTTKRSFQQNDAVQGGTDVGSSGVEQKSSGSNEHPEGEVRDSIQVLCNGLVACVLSVLFSIERSASGCACVTNARSPLFDSHQGRFDSVFAFLVYVFFGDAHVRIRFTDGCFLESSYVVAILASIACACGDTLASELGGLLSGTDPHLITTWRRVPRGTNGAVSYVGLLFSAVGGALVGVPFLVACVLHEYLTCADRGIASSVQTVDSEQLLVSIMYYFTVVRVAAEQFTIVPLLALAGLLGSLVDSLLGATLQFSGLHKRSGRIVSIPDGDNVEHVSGLPLLDNNAVNFVATLLTAVFMPFIAFAVWPH